MSNEYINGVIAHSQSKRSARAVLIAIANRAGNDGTCQLLHSTIADEAGVSERTVTRAIAQLAALGEIEVLDEERRHSSPQYRILLQPKTSGKGRQNGYAKPDSSIDNVSSSIDKLTPSIDKLSDATYTRDLNPIEPNRTQEDDATHRRPKRAKSKRKPISEKPPAEDAAPKETGEWQNFVGALCWVCFGHQDVQMLTEEQRGQLTAEAKRIRDKGYDRDALKAWFVDVWKLDWRWVKNKDRPKPCDVRSSIATTKAKTPEGFDNASSERNAATYHAGKTKLTPAEWEAAKRIPNGGPY